MKVQLTCLFSILSTLTACGSHSNSRGQLNRVPSIPAAAIIAVADEDTVSVAQNPDDLRTVNSELLQMPAEQIQDQDLPKIHKQAQKSETILTQEQAVVVRPNLRGWLHYRRCPSQLVRVSYETQQEPLILDSCQAYQQYQPVYMLQGKAHRFLFQRAYRLQNITYFYYVSAKTDTGALSQTTDKGVDESKQKTEQTPAQTIEQKEEVQQQEKTPYCHQQEQEKQVVKTTTAC